MLAVGADRGSSVQRRRLRVVHCVGFYFPESTGGTEVYVRDLTKALLPHAIDGTIIAATNGAANRYRWQGFDVIRYRPDATNEPAEAPGGGPLGNTAFKKIVEETKPDLFHLHSWTTGAGLDHLQQAAELGIPSVVTVHVPAALCMRGTMLLEGTRPCDGRIDDKRCARCFALYRGLPMPAAWLVSQLPKWDLHDGEISRILPRASALFSLRANAGRKARKLHVMAALSKRIVAPSQWVRAALAANAIPLHKIVVSAQAASETFSQRAARRRGDDNEVVIGFLGRLVVEKGPDLVIRAMGHVSQDLPVRLRVAGTGEELTYERRIRRLAARDPRIELVGLVEHEQVAQFLESIDVLAVPSRYMETGPLVVQEAQALGIPVMGANLGGIAERVRDGIDGWLLPFDDARAWAAAIVEAVSDRGKLAKLSQNMQRNRTVADVAADMASLYHDVIAENAVSEGESRPA
ncbi:glycosyltransferase [Reyranella soli]|uniref:LPS biosynthesis protein RfbU n=1 Tax=Reyranella soli TaxID=1230389 RepID=A0A512NC85_9HYPH|nr:glycosyltransferase [Reyranella soli]GEP56563.1 LPS biosynthesis protein RfbU [Reyranella soli]